MSDPWFKFFPSDFIAGTSGLSPAERGVYITLLCLIYEEDGAIPRDDGRLSRRCGAPKAAFTRILAELIEQSKITEKDGMLSNDRAEKALVDRRNRTQNAYHAATSRWGAQPEETQQKQGDDDAGAMQSQGVGDASLEPEPELSKKEDTNVSLQVSPAGDVSEAVRIYNDAASQAGWPSVQKLTPTRSRSLKARVADAGGMDGWRFAIERAAKSDFLSGRTDKPWTGFGFDWLTKAANFTKLMEGNYDNRSATNPTGNPTGGRGPHHSLMAGFAAVANRN